MKEPSIQEVNRAREAVRQAGAKCSLAAEAHRAAVRELRKAQKVLEALTNPPEPPVRTPRAKLGWRQVSPRGQEKLWVSTCGRYRIWVQARPRDDRPHYGAAVVEGDDSPGGGPWLTSTSTFKEAKELCAEHAARNPNPKTPPDSGAPTSEEYQPA